MVDDHGEPITDENRDEAPEGVEVTSDKDGDKSVFDAVTQKKVDGIIKARLLRETEKFQVIEGKLKVAEDALVAASDEAAAAAGAFNDLEAKFKASELKNQKLSFALNEGISSEAVESLKGDTVEELKESFEKLKKSGFGEFGKVSEKVFPSKKYGASSNLLKSDMMALSKIRL